MARIDDIDAAEAYADQAKDYVENAEVSPRDRAIIFSNLAVYHQLSELNRQIERAWLGTESQIHDIQKSVEVIEQIARDAEAPADAEPV